MLPLHSFNSVLLWICEAWQCVFGFTTKMYIYYYYNTANSLYFKLHCLIHVLALNWTALFPVAMHELFLRRTANKTNSTSSCVDAAAAVACMQHFSWALLATFVVANLWLVYPFDDLVTKHRMFTRQQTIRRLEKPTDNNCICIRDWSALRTHHITCHWIAYDAMRCEAMQQNKTYYRFVDVLHYRSSFPFAQQSHAIASNK